MTNIKTGDTVIVTTGKDKGKKGKVQKVLRDDHKVVVEGVGKVKKHIKRSLGGGIIEKFLPIHISNVMLLDSSGKPTRTGITLEGDKKTRVAKTDGKKV